MLERENTVLLQKSVNDLNDRLVVIEKMLKEVEYNLRSYTVIKEYLIKVSILI